MTLIEIIENNRVLQDAEISRLQERINELKNRLDILKKFLEDVDSINKELFDTVAETDSYKGKQEFDRAYKLIGKYQKYSNQPQTKASKDYLCNFIRSQIERYSAEISQREEIISNINTNRLNPELENKILNYDENTYITIEEIDELLGFLSDKETDKEVRKFFIEVAKNNLKIERTKGSIKSKEMESREGILDEIYQSGILLPLNEVESIDLERSRTEEVSTIDKEKILREKNRLIESYNKFLNNEELKEKDPYVFEFVSEKLANISEEISEMDDDDFNELLEMYTDELAASQYFKYRLLDIVQGENVDEVISNIKEFVRTESTDLIDHFEIEGYEDYIETINNAKAIIENSNKFNYTHESFYIVMFVDRLKTYYDKILDLVFGNQEITEETENMISEMITIMDSMIDNYNYLNYVNGYLRDKNDSVSKSIKALQVELVNNYSLGNLTDEEKNTLIENYLNIIKDKMSSNIDSDFIDELFSSPNNHNYLLFLNKELIKDDIERITGSNKAAKAQVYNDFIQSLYLIASYPQLYLDKSGHDSQKKKGGKNEYGVKGLRKRDYRTGFVKIGNSGGNAIYAIIGIDKGSVNNHGKSQTYSGFLKRYTANTNLANNLRGIIANNSDAYSVMQETGSLDFIKELVSEYNKIIGGQVL